MREKERVFYGAALHPTRYPTLKASSLVTHVFLLLFCLLRVRLKAKSLSLSLIIFFSESYTPLFMQGYALNKRQSTRSSRQ